MWYYILKAYIKMGTGTNRNFQTRCKPLRCENLHRTCSHTVVLLCKRCAQYPQQFNLGKSCNLFLSFKQLCLTTWGVYPRSSFNLDFLLVPCRWDFIESKKPFLCTIHPASNASTRGTKPIEAASCMQSFPSQYFASSHSSLRILRVSCYHKGFL